MYSGVAGLKTHQTKMDVIGNNIANVNTVAFKSQSVTFSELMYQTTQNASGANAQTGTAGINARQIGLGVKTGAINTAIASQGASQTTNNPFDIRITGDAFFIVSNGQNNYFTRDGSFYVDGLGNLAMTSNGYNVMGWQVDPADEQIKQDTVSPLRIMSAENMTYEPEATTQARITGIVDKLDPNVTRKDGKNMNLMFYDKLGYAYTAKINLKSTDTDGMYAVSIDSIVDADNVPINIPKAVADNIFDSQAELTNAQITKLMTALDGLEDPAGSGIFKAKQDVDNAEGKRMVSTGDVLYTRNQTDAPDWQKIAYALKGNGYDFDGKANVTDADVQKLADQLQTYRLTYTNSAVKEGEDPEVVDLGFKDYMNKKTITLKYTYADSTNANTLMTKSYDTDAVALMTDPTLAASTLSADEKTALANNALTGMTTTCLYYNVATGKFEGIGNRGVDNTKITLNIADLVTINPLTGKEESNFEDIEIDFASTTMFNNSGTSTVSASNGDANKLGTGRKLGNMSGVTIQDDGRIYASYDNGMSRLLGQIAVAEFPNASGLEKEGDNLYKASQNSGDFDGIGIDIKTGGGYMTTGVLEMSNVDLSAEFTDMITTQRGFQANSRIITVSDTLLEELVNLKR